MSKSDRAFPDSWALVKIGDVLDIQGGSQPPKAEFIYETRAGYVQLLQIRDFGESPVPTYVPERRVTKFCSKDDVLIARYGASLGRIVTGLEGAYNVALAKVIDGYQLFSKKYLFYLLKTSVLQTPLKMISRSAQNGFAKHEIAHAQLPLPPRPEQNRIVAKIEELFSELDKGIENLKIAHAQLKVYRQALLKHAFEGKLTAWWRAENQDKLESAEALLKRIQTERAQHYQQQLTAWETAGKQGPKPKTPKTLPPLTTEELAELPELPEGWGWVKVDAYCDVEKNSIKAGPFGSSLKKEFYVKEGYKVYGQEQVISGDWRYGDYFIDEAKYLDLESCKVKPLDILISLVGTVGKVLVLPENIASGVINPRLVKISPNLKFVTPEFFKYYFESSFLKGLYKLKTHGATMDVLNLGIIQDLPFPICSLKEQQILIQEIESRVFAVDRLDQNITAALQQAEALRQSILKKAFSGQLVPQDPHDEPASALLARIKAEKASIAKNGTASAKSRKPARRKA